MAGRHRARARAASGWIGTVAGAGLILNGSIQAAVWCLSILAAVIIFGVMAITAGVLFSGRDEPTDRLAHLLYHVRKPDLCPLCWGKAEQVHSPDFDRGAHLKPLKAEERAVVPQVLQKRRMHPNG